MKKDYDLSRAMEYANRVLCKCLTGDSVKIEDIELNNVRRIIKIILKAYYLEKIGELDFCNFLDSIELVIHRKFAHLFSETLYPDFRKDDKRSLAFDAIHYIQIIGADFKKESVPVFLCFLDAFNPSSAHDELISYIHKEYDYTKNLIY